MVLPQAATTSLQGFHAVRRVCRAATRRRASLGAALLFNGDSLLVLLEGLPDDLLACADHIVTLVGQLPFDSWTGSIAPGEGRHLPAGTCRLGYLDVDQRCDEVQADGGGVAGRIQAFMRLFAASDHD